MLLLATACSAVAAGLWSANIAALFPIIDVSLRGESPQAWNQRHITEGQARRDAVSRNIEALQIEVAKATGAEQRKLLASLQDLEISKGSESVQIESARKLQPWLDKYVPADPFQFLLAIIGFLILATVAKQALQLLANLLVARVSQDIARNIRHKVFDKTLELDRASFLAAGPSGFSVQITQVCDMLATGIQSVFGGGVSEPLKLFACLMGAAFISWRLLLASMLFVPVAAFAIMWLNRKLRTIARSTLDRSQGLYHVMHEALQNMATVQVFGMEQREKDRFREATLQMRRLGLRAALYNNLVTPVTEILGVSMICITIGVGAYLFLSQRSALFGVTLMDKPLGVAGLMVFLGMLIGAMDPVRRLSGVVTGINNGMVAADGLYPLLDRPSMTGDPAKPISPPRPHGQLRFEGVSFGYRVESPVLRDLTLNIPFGETVAVIGANGTGKSTLVNLLCRFYLPQQGSITLDGVPLPAMSRVDLRGRIAVVAQHTELFNESLLYNIRYGSFDATDEAVKRAATLARADEFIEQMPEKYETTAGPNGMRLSGGQRQRIALARALLRDPEILILDEATSQIDVESERVIHEALAAFKGTRTILLITHRASALSLADRVIRLELGGGAEEVRDLRLAAA